MTKLESDLRAALHARAARIHASPGLLAAEYHPRTRRLRPAAAIGGSVALASGALAVVLSLAGGAGSAFAGWTAAPTQPAPGQIADAKADCADHPAFPGLPLKLADVRGPFTFLVYSDGASNDFCTLGPSFRNSSGWSASPPVAVAAGRLFLWAEHTTTDSGEPYTFVIAQAADDVSGAELTLEDGSVVTATVENGWAVAWWPGSQTMTSAQLTTPSGTQTQTFPAGPNGGAPGGG